VLRSLVGSRLYSTGRLVWSDGEGFNGLAAVRYSTSFKSRVLVYTTESNIVEECRSFLPGLSPDYRLPYQQSVRTYAPYGPAPYRPTLFGLLRPLLNGLICRYSGLIGTRYRAAVRNLMYFGAWPSLREFLTEAFCRTFWC